MSISDIGAYFGFSATGMGALAATYYAYQRYCARPERQSQCIAGPNGIQLHIGTQVEALQRVDPRHMSPAQVQQLTDIIKRANEASREAITGIVEEAVSDALERGSQRDSSSDVGATAVRPPLHPPGRLVRSMSPPHPILMPAEQV